MNEFLSDPIVWYSLGIVLFFFAAYRFGGKPLTAYLDGEIATIRADLDQAAAMRASAEATLRECEGQQQAALLEAERILTHAREEAARMKVAAQEELKMALARQEQRSTDRIRQAEEQALMEVRAAAVDQAMAAARAALAARDGDIATGKLVDEVIGQLPRLVANQAL